MNDDLVRFMVFNATFNNISVISWQLVLLVEETRIPSEYHWLVTSFNSIKYCCSDLWLKYTIKLWNKHQVNTQVAVFEFQNFNLNISDENVKCTCRFRFYIYLHWFPFIQSFIALWPPRLCFHSLIPCGQIRPSI